MLPGGNTVIDNDIAGAPDGDTVRLGLNPSGALVVVDIKNRHRTRILLAAVSASRAHRELQGMAGFRLL